MALSQAGKLDTQKQETDKLAAQAVAEEREAAEQESRAQAKKEEAERDGTEAKKHQADAAWQRQQSSLAKAKQDRDTSDAVKAQRQTSEQELTARRLLYNAHLAIARKASPRAATGTVPAPRWPATSPSRARTIFATLAGATCGCGFPTS